MHQQVDTTGVENLDKLLDLEILFLTFDEVGALEHCSNLRRLSCELTMFSVISIVVDLLINCSSSLPRPG